MSTLTFPYTHNMVVFLEKPAESEGFHKAIDLLNANQIHYALTVNPTIYTSCIEHFWETAKREGKDFSRRVTPLFATIMVQANQEKGVDSATPTDSHSTSIITQPSSSKPQKKKSSRKRRKDSAPTKSTTEETTPEENVATPSCDPPQSGEDRMKFIELMNLYTQLQSRVLALETTKSNQALEIESLKRRVKGLDKRRKSRTPGFKRLRKEDASKQRRKFTDLNANGEVTLVDETQEMDDDNLMFNTVSVDATTKSIPISDVEVVTSASTNVEIPDELTLAQTLIEIKIAKPVTTAATTVTSVRPRAKGIIFHDQEEQVSASTKTFSSSQSQVKDKGKGIMVEPLVPLKKKDQVALDE
ncbi:hypothetical protein Tco_1429126 [Tanacetum coccineum]